MNNSKTNPTVSSVSGSTSEVQIQIDDIRAHLDVIVNKPSDYWAQAVGIQSHLVRLDELFSVEDNIQVDKKVLEWEEKCLKYAFKKAKKLKFTDVSLSFVCRRLLKRIVWDIEDKNS
jgi:hypothetical protein